MRHTIRAFTLLLQTGIGACALQRMTVGMFAGIIMAVSGTAQAQNLCAQVGFSIDDRTSNCGTTGPVTTGKETRVNPNRTTSTQKAEAEATADYGQLHVASSVTDAGQAGGHAGWADSFTITGPTPGTLAPSS